ncbi:MAG: MFS transporter [Micrococcales bacterium]
MARPAWLSANLVRLSWVSLLQDAASEMLYPLLPIFLNGVLGAPAIIVGAIESAAEGMAALTKLLSARINQYLSKKTMVVSGYGLAAVGKLLIALATVWPVVMLARVVDRLGKGLRSASRDAVMLEGSKREHRGKIIGFHRTADTLGAVVGPSIALFLLALFSGDLRSVLWIAVIPAVLSVAVTFTVRDGSTATKRAKAIQAEALPKNVKGLIWAIGLFSVANFPDALILLHLSQTGWTVAEVVGAYLLYNLSTALLSYPAGLISDRVRPNIVYGFGVLCFSAAYGSLALVESKTIELLLIVIYGVFAAVNDTVGKSWISKLAGDSGQLTAQSLLQGFSGFGVLVAGIWAGLAWGSYGIIPLAISSVVGLGVAVYVFSLRLK